MVSLPAIIPLFSSLAASTADNPALMALFSLLPITLMAGMIGMLILAAQRNQWDWFLVILLFGPLGALAYYVLADQIPRY